MMNPHTTAIALIEHLERMRQRPGLYLGPLDHHVASRFRCFMSGVQVALQSGNLSYAEQRHEVLELVVRTRGWAWTPTAPQDQMEEQHATPHAILDELVQIEIDILTCVYARPGETSAVAPTHRAVASNSD